MSGLTRRPAGHPGASEPGFGRGGGFLDIDVVGWILMAAGVIGLIVTMSIWGGRRREVVTTHPTEVHHVEERRDVDVL